MHEEETYDVVAIPPNYQGTIILFGMAFAKWNLIEAVVLAVIIFFAVLAVLIRHAASDLSTLIGWAAVPAVSAGVLALRGINGDDLLSFLRHVIVWQRKRRIAYYNPRVKTEAFPAVGGQERSDRNPLPREKIIALYSGYREKFGELGRERTAGNTDAAEAADMKDMYFEDDIGIIDKPAAYMTQAERRAFERMIRRRKKQEARAHKQKKGGLLSGFRKKKKKQAAGIRQT